MLSAQSSFGPVNAELSDRVETGDTVGFAVSIPVYFRQHTRENEETMLAHIVASEYYSILREYEPAMLHIRTFHHLDSLLHPSALKGMEDYAEGLYYFSKEDYQIGLLFLNKAALAFNNSATNITQARCFTIRGLILNTLQNQAASEKSYKIALDYYHRSGNVKREAAVYNNMGITKTAARDSAGAMHYLLRSLAIRDSLKDNYGIGQASNNLGALMYEFHHYAEALDYYRKGFEYRKMTTDMPLSGIIESKINIGKALHKLGNDKEAQQILEEAFKETPGERLELKRRASMELMEIYALQHDYKRAFDMQNIYYFAKDSLYGLSKKEEINRMTTKYDFDNVRAQDSLKLVLKENADHAAQEAKDKQNNFIVASLLIGLSVAGVFVYFLYRSNTENKRKNILISTQRDILDKKQQEITESIQYAHYIQEALLPDNATLEKNLPQHFIFYRPKDIVSGDFYWHWPTKNKNESLLAVADCTGHGVPGAFMSLLGKESLDKSATVSEDPGEILSHLNRAVKQSLRQNAGKGTRDGMDIALIRINESEKKLLYAGANRPLWIIRKNHSIPEEIKPTKAAIGGFTPDEQIFETKELTVGPGDTLYIFTDGYADQFGGPKQKKMTTKKFREALSGMSALSMEKQKSQLEENLVAWKGTLEQVDDILVIGMRF